MSYSILTCPLYTHSCTHARNTIIISHLMVSITHFAFWPTRVKNATAKLHYTYYIIMYIVCIYCVYFYYATRMPAVNTFNNNNNNCNIMSTYLRLAAVDDIIVSRDLQ